MEKQRFVTVTDNNTNNKQNVSEKETTYLLKSGATKKRLLKAKERTEGISLEDARARLRV